MPAVRMTASSLGSCFIRTRSEAQFATDCLLLLYSSNLSLRDKRSNIGGVTQNTLFSLYCTLVCDDGEYPIHPHASLLLTYLFIFSCDV